ncbi:MAG: HEPN domain-containing protein [Proteobacteria bacterium]|nr:HEPN domain-containing protein [Pseudomonadota bacterium]
MDNRPLSKKLNQNEKGILKNHIEQLIMSAKCGMVEVAKGKFLGKDPSFDPDILCKIRSFLESIDYIDEREIYDFFNRWLLSIMQSLEDLEPVLKSKALKDETLIKEFTEMICEDLLLWPLKYQVLVPLPSVRLPTDYTLRISDEIELFKMTQEKMSTSYPPIKTENIDESSVKYSRSVPVASISYIALTAYGSEKGGTSSALFMSGIRSLKIVVAALVACKLFKTGSDQNGWQKIFSPYDLLCVEDAKGCYCRYSEAKEGYYWKLPDEVWNYLVTLELDLESLTRLDLDKARIEKKKQNRDLVQKELHNMLQQKLKNIQKLFPSTEGTKREKDGERVKTALEWFFEGLMNPNKTFSFIQFAIALEALFGEENDNRRSGVTERLSNRFAYSIAKNPVERREVHDKIASIYEVRSTIVHTGKIALTESVYKDYNILKEYLMDGLSQEISLLI